MVVMVVVAVAQWCCWHVCSCCYGAAGAGAALPAVGLWQGCLCSPDRHRLVCLLLAHLLEAACALPLAKHAWWCLPATPGSHPAGTPTPRRTRSTGGTTMGLHCT